MLPLILGLAGGFLVGSSIKKNVKFKDGGYLNTVDNFDELPVLLNSDYRKQLEQLNNADLLDLIEKEFKKNINPIFEEIEEFRDYYLNILTLKKLIIEYIELKKYKDIIDTWWSNEFHIQFTEGLHNIQLYIELGDFEYEWDYDWYNMIDFNVVKTKIIFVENNREFEILKFDSTDCDIFDFKNSPIFNDERKYIEEGVEENYNMDRASEGPEPDYYSKGGNVLDNIEKDLAKNLINKEIEISYLGTDEPVYSQEYRKSRIDKIDLIDFCPHSIVLFMRKGEEIYVPFSKINDLLNNKIIVLRDVNDEKFIVELKDKQYAQGSLVEDDSEDWYEYKKTFMSKDIVNEMGYVWENMNIDERMNLLSECGYAFADPEKIKDKDWNSFSREKKAELTYVYRN